MATAIIGARIDYCNSVLYGTTERNLNRLQRAQNATARIVHQASFQTSATALRQQLHWLPIRQRITYKLATLKISRQSKSTVGPHCTFTNSFETIRLPEHFALLPLHCFTDHLCPPSSPLGRSTILHLKSGAVCGHPQDRRTLSVVLGDA